MTIEDRLRKIVSVRPEQANVTLPVLLVKEWLDLEVDDPLADLTVADVAEQLGRSPGTVRYWIDPWFTAPHQGLDCPSGEIVR